MIHHLHLSSACRALLAAARPAVWGVVSAAILTLHAAPFELAAQPLGPATARLLWRAISESAPKIRLRGPVPTAEERLIWLEVTPLESDAPPVRYVLRADTRDVPVLGIAKGAIMACIGIDMRSVTCREAYVEPVSPTFAGPDTVAAIPITSIAIEIERGVPIVGRYRQGFEPIVGARVSVVPDGLDARRPFVMPLGIGDPDRAGVAHAAQPSAERPRSDRSRRSSIGRIAREVLTGRDGQFRLPELAPGSYRLETLLPTGRLHHGPVFVAVARSPTLSTLDLGVIVVPDGLAMAVQVLDDAGAPIARAAVTARQGERVLDAALFQARTDVLGWASLTGFRADLPLHLRCEAAGHVPQVMDHTLLPVEAECVLERQARLRGQAIGPSGSAPVDTQLTLLRLAEPEGDGDLAGNSRQADDEEAGREDRGDRAGGKQTTVAVQGRTSITGTFDLRQLDPGDYRLRLSAPGFAVESRDIRLEPGAISDLGIIYLAAAPTLEGIVVDAEDDTPLANVVVVVLRPAGGGVDLTDNDGAFTVTDTRAEGALEIEARHPDYAVTRLSIPATTGRAKREPTRLGLHRGGRILVVVWDANSGRTCQGCAVRIEPGHFELTTDADGEVLSDLLPPGRYRVELSRITHLGSIVVEEPEAAVRYVRVREAGIAPVWFGERTQPVRVRFRPRPDPGWALIGRSKDRAQRVEPDSDGAFTLEQKAGEIIGLYLQGWDDRALATVEVRQGRLPPGEGPREVVLNLPSGELRGHLTTDGGNAGGVRVRLRGLHDGTRTALLASAPDGDFRVPHLPPGIYALEVGQRPLKFVRIGSGERVNLGTWDLLPGSF